MIASLRADMLGAEARTEVCIIGGGAAGVTLALELSARGKSVILVESGGLDLEPDTQKLCDGDSVGHPIELDDGRHRVLGGAATRWTGRCAKLDPIDFERRDWVPFSGWPIGLEEIEPFYARAATYCGFGAPWSGDGDYLAAHGVKAPDLETDRVAPFIWRFAPQPGLRRYRDWGRDYRDELSRRKNLRVILHANATGFECAPNGGHVESIVVAALTGARMRIAADNFVLCCGGAENARLLLSSAESAPALLHDRSGAVGRYLMQHARGRIATIEATPAEARRLQETFNVVSRRNGTQFELGFAMPAQVQRAERLVNCSAVLTYDADPNSAWERAKRALRGKSKNPLGDAAHAFGRFDQVALNAWRRGALGRQPVLETRQINLVVDLEQAPDPESRLTLADTRDALGMRRIKADWRIGELERKTAARFAELVAGEFARLGLARVKPEPWARDGAAMPSEGLAGTHHHIATTRMSESPRDGVVDAKCKVHGVANLFVQGCSVFPTGGHANPTLTIVALALRQAEILLTL